MGQPPAIVIVVRHGVRLDATDKQWHLTSPTPYDPPLTYGGWTQSRALGARIASILRSRETDDQSAPCGDGGNDEKSGKIGRRRRHKVIIHTSPFLRCVQTSIAISAGLAQNPGLSHTKRPLSSHSASSVQSHSSPRIRPTITTESLAPIMEPSSPVKVNDKHGHLQTNIKRSTLRVDAFLGEWLSPDYFDLITPPPGSIMMVAGAKADLLRREDYSNLIQVREVASASAFQGFPGGWGSPVVAPISDQDDGPLTSMSSLGQALPRRDRSLSSSGSNGSRHNGKILTKVSTADPSEYGVYQPPVPSYAISNSVAIPPGFVAHARDACVNVDYQWDSMREPQNWGNGGEYGEEWSSMHKRFRRGLQQLIHFYRDHDDPCKLAAKTPSTNGGIVHSGGANQEDEDTDLVVILVTHGAGCNALIGALTNQPVLLDVGTASLTMAVRKSTPETTPASTPTGTPTTDSRRASRTLTISDEYDVKLVANTEHLRPSMTSTPTLSQDPSLVGFNISRYFGSSNEGGSSVEADRSRSVITSGNFGNIRRTTSAATTPLSRIYTLPRTSSTGLWSAPQHVDEEAIEEPGDDMVLNFGNDGTSQLSPAKMDKSETAEEQPEEDDVPPLGGLWSASRLTREAGIVREIALKRRWTVNEPGMA